VGRAASFRPSGRPADTITECNHALALDPAFIPALRARADVLESIGVIPDSLRDLDHLKLLYDAALRDGKLLGPSWARSRARTASTWHASSSSAAAWPPATGAAWTTTRSRSVARLHADGAGARAPPARVALVFMPAG
jgi:hypothetical protein